MSIAIKDKSEFDLRFKFTYDPQVMNHKLSKISELETQIHIYTIRRRDSMFSTFRLGSAAS